MKGASDKILLQETDRSMTATESRLEVRSDPPAL